MPTCTRCAGLTKALRSAEKQNLAHVKRADALEALLREMVDRGELAPAVLGRLQGGMTSLTRWPT
jgi:hypothetical protein